MDCCESTTILAPMEIACDTEDIKIPEVVCSEDLRLADKNHDCSLFSRLLITLARFQSKRLEDDKLNKALEKFESYLNTDRPCVLLHELTKRDGVPFRGTIHSFEAQIPVDCDIDFVELACPAVTSDVLASFCRICLDNELTSSALNLALQMHLLAQAQDRLADSESITSMDCSQFTLLSDNIGSPEIPRGLSQQLWTRLCEPYHSFRLETSCDGDNERCGDTSFLGWDAREVVSLPTTTTATGDGSHPPVEPSTASSHADYLTGIYDIVKRESNGHPEELTAVDLSVHFETILPVQMSVEMNEEPSEIPNGPPSSTQGAPARSSILKCNEKSAIALAVDEPTKLVRKRVRFSLSSSHPPPELEDEYGGRSNRRRLLDFARRRQLLDDVGDNLTDLVFPAGVCAALINLLYSPVLFLLACLQHLLPACRHTSRFWVVSILFSLILVAISTYVYSAHYTELYSMRFIAIQLPISSLRTACQNLCNYFSNLIREYVNR